MWNNCGHGFQNDRVKVWASHTVYLHFQDFKTTKFWRLHSSMYIFGRIMIQTSSPWPPRSSKRQSKVLGITCSMTWTSSVDFKTSVGHQIQHSYKVHGPQNDSVRHQIQHSYKVHGPQNDSVRHQIQHSYKVHGSQNDSVRHQIQHSYTVHGLQNDILDIRYSIVTKYMDLKTTECPTSDTA